MDFETIKNLKNILSLIYIIPTYFLYFIILYIMFWNSSTKSKFYNSSFYQLFGYSAINYIIQSFFYYASFRFTYTPAFFELVKNCVQSLWIYPFLFAFMYYSAAALHLYSLALSFNRLTAFIFKMNYTNFWKKWLKFILAFCVLFPILFAWHFPFVRVECTFEENEGALIYPRNSAAVGWMKNSRNLFIEILITSSLSLGMNVFVIFHLLKRKYYSKNKNTATNNKISSQDIKMLIYTMLIFSTEIGGCFQQLLLTFWPSTFQSFVSETQFILADISTLAPAWFILATNKHLRNGIINLLCLNCNKINDVKVSVVVNAATMTAIA